MMLKGPKLISNQWKMLSSAFSNMSQAIILFSLTAFFVPEAISLNKDYPHVNAIGFLFWGLFTLGIAVIISRKGK